jgi:hypothetical protein
MATLATAEAGLPVSFDTQDAAIEKLLRSRYGQWVPCYELADLALQYGRAIHSIRKRLRAAGDVERVPNKLVRVNGKAHGSFRIARTADFVAEHPVAPADPPAAPSSGSGDWYGKPRPTTAIEDLYLVSVNEGRR